MPALSIEPTDSTPKIYLNRESGKFEIAGKSFPEESRSFYAPVFEWFIHYEQNPNRETVFEFKMEYFNSSSSLILLEILNILNKMHKEGKKVKVIWNYLEIDDDMLDAGEEYAELVEVPFEYNPINEIIL